ncbi:hypothetical protein F2P81_017796 [Scophthalmus maximus]|uniref:Cadherin-like beta-sandwich-like domain-containing protein n=1 Tax=Scophthalmus maximus TaxID=52904 RepID=A0A6A4SC76_SCOMX|nr:hypothetical protein F2P81_017796 [Scophthalmus maximus]
MLLRRRSWSGPLLLLGVAVCLVYQTLMVARNRLRSGPRPATGGKSTDELVQVGSQRRAVVLTGRRRVWDPEVQLYQRVLQQMDYDVHVSRYAETCSLLRANQGVSGWSLLLCLSGSERSCLRRISFSHLQRHQMVNLIPELREAFSDEGAGLCHLTGSDLPMRPHSCGSTNQKLSFPEDSPSPVQAQPPGLVAMVNVYVLVTLIRPLTSFLHNIVVVTTPEEQRGQPRKLRDFLLQQLGPASSHHALGQVKEVISEVLQAAAATNEKKQRVDRCVWCYQLLTFTLMFSRSVTPVIVQVDTDVTFSDRRDDTFDGQITKDLILEDTLNFLLTTHTHLSSGRQTEGQTELYPSSSSSSCSSSSSSSSSSSYYSSSSSSRPLSVSDLLIRIICYYELQKNFSSRSDDTDASTNQEPGESSQDGAAGGGSCVDPHLRQIYSDPPLTLTPPFSPGVKQYRADVTFDTVMVRIRPVPVSSACRVHLDEHRGPRMANYPVGLGNSRISILVTDDGGSEPVVMTIYTVNVNRETRPSLPMFGDHVTCSFVQVGQTLVTRV